jgi:hypothetical protein
MLFAHDCPAPDSAGSCDLGARTSPLVVLLSLELAAATAVLLANCGDTIGT